MRQSNRNHPKPGISFALERNLYYTLHMQPSPRCSYIGIAYCGGQKPLAIACLDGRQKVQALSIGRLKDIYAFCAGQAEALVVCGLPLSRPTSGDQRPVELELNQRGLPTYHTSAEAQSYHPASRLGAELAELFSTLGYSQNLESDTSCLFMESHPAAAFQHLLGLRPFDSHTLEGRLQRQLLLFERELPIPDPMDFFEEVTRHKLLHGILPTRDLYAPPELDALVLAHTAWLAANQPEDILTLGDISSAQILLPQPF